MGEVIHRCMWCDQLNRVPAEGNKRVNCGKCRAPLPNQRILRYLLNVHVELQQISKDALKTAWSSKQIRSRLVKQQLLVAHAEQHFSGFAATVGAAGTLVPEMQATIFDIEVALQRRGMLETVAKAALVFIARALRVQLTASIGVPLAGNPSITQGQVRAQISGT